MTPTLSVEAFQARLTLLDVGVPTTCRLPGVLGGVVSPPPPPPAQEAPLSLQFDGTPDPLTTKPKLAEPPAATLPLYSRLVATTCPPDWLTSASQNVPTLVPAGRSNSTFHDVMAVAVPLAIVYLPW